ncbi:hypothetical protein [Sphingomonas sp.]|uniref:hypothetical protein n=1 Tax=Sphingomonas sp. TaxID=28214 RepID=UPI002FD9D627
MLLAAALLTTTPCGAAGAGGEVAAARGRRGLACGAGWYLRTGARPLHFDRRPAGMGGSGSGHHVAETWHIPESLSGERK